MQERRLGLFENPLQREHKLYTALTDSADRVRDVKLVNTAQLYI